MGTQVARELADLARPGMDLAADREAFYEPDDSSGCLYDHGL